MELSFPPDGLPAGYGRASSRSVRGLPSFCWRASARTGAREASCADFGVGVWAFNPKLVVLRLSLLLKLPPLPGTPHCESVQTPEEPMRDPKTLWRIRPDVNVVSVRLPSAESTAKVPPFSMRGVPAIAANPREGSRLRRLCLKSQTPTPKSAQLASRASGIRHRPC